MVMTASGLAALDILLRPATQTPVIAPPRPLEKLGFLLKPASIAIAGVSNRLNIGHIILNNILRQGFPSERLWVVKPDATEIEGCSCFADFDSLPEPVDLAVLSIEAKQLPGLVDEIVRGKHAESLILIPGGLGEREGSEDQAARLEAVIRRSRITEGGGPVINGGNCLGVRSLPGRYDTLFIPSHKLTFKADHVAPLALLSQSGAFAVARASKLESFNPTYIITFGNQADLTLGDYLTYLEADPRISVFACYIEGFRTLDGQRFLEATRKITASGRAVILYRAGRTHAGASAAASHTASVAGSYRVACELTRGAGGLVAESLEDFEDLVRTFTLLAGRRPSGLRLGAISNAGFESVAIGDNLGELDLATLGSETRSRLTDLFLHHRVGTIVAPRNPLDVHPVLGDEAFAQASRAILEDPEVDIGVIGCVPLTGALQTLPVGKGHDENLTTNVSVIQRLITLWHDELKPWVAVIDAGRLYDPAASALHEAGIPTFRSVDRALRALGTWTLFHLKQRSLPGPR
jgi:acyl-CoA synthetase (NDP forming)